MTSAWKVLGWGGWNKQAREKGYIYVYGTTKGRKRIYGGCNDEVRRIQDRDAR